MRMHSAHSIASSYLKRINCFQATFFIFISIAATTGQPANAQQSTPTPLQAAEATSHDDHNQIIVYATHTAEPLVIDGLLEDEIYRSTKPIDRFIQQVPNEGEPATDTTEVWIFFDEKNLYVSGRFWDEEPNKILANELRRDSFGIYLNDNFAVAIDTFNDGRNGFLFQTNAIGGMGDGYMTDERVHDRDFNTVWRSRSQKFDSGWTVEMAIPFKSLRFKTNENPVWGINFRRINQKKNEHSFVTEIPASLGGRGIYKMSSAASLVGLSLPSTSKHLELKPYVLTTMTTNLEAEPPFSNKKEGDFGFDMKYGVTRGLTLDLTYNTDFAQVEADEQQVNLTRFSLFFPEKREFFLEGSGIFSFGDPGGAGGRGRSSSFRPPSNTPLLFFSRRIGLDDGKNIPLVAGGRLSGRAGNYSIGALATRTSDPELAKGDTDFTVLRLKRNIFRRSNIGILATHRKPSDSTLGINHVLGVDMNLSFFQDLRINGYYAFTRTNNISSSENESYNAKFDYAGDKYGVRVNHLTVEKDFSPEIGFLRRNDFRRNFAELRYSPRPKRIEAIRKIRLETSLEHITNNRGKLETRQIELSHAIEFESGNRLNISYHDNFEYLDEYFEIADGIIIPPGDYSFSNMTTTYWIGGGSSIFGSINFLRGDFFSGDRTQVSYNGRWAISPNFSMEPNLALNFVDLPEGSFVARLISTRATFMASPRMFASVLTQYNSSNDSLNANVRVRWEYSPGSDLFVVYSEGRLIEHGNSFSVIKNKSLAVKLTRLLRF